MESIFDLLDWNKTKVEQELGREKAREIKDISCFLQPSNPQYNKNVWDNCAVVLSEKSNEELSPYFLLLLQWLQDLNWPGALCIMNRLLVIETENFFKAFKITYNSAKTAKDEVWLNNISKFIENDALKQHLETSIAEDLLERYKNYWNEHGTPTNL